MPVLRYRAIEQLERGRNMRSLKACNAVAFAVTLAASVVHAQDMPDGFRGIKWGWSSAVLGTNATKIRSHRLPWGAMNECYVRANEVLKLGDAELKGIHYCFYNDRFDAVTVVARAQDERLLRSIVTAAFGPPEEGKGNVWGWNEPMPGRSRAILAVIEGEARLLFVASDSTVAADAKNHRQQQAKKEF